MSSNALNAPEATSQSSDPSEIPRGWWKWNAHRTNAIGVEETLQTLKGVLAKDIYDVFIYHVFSGVLILNVTP